MKGEVFLDTNVLIYTTLADDPRAAVARSLLGAGAVISVQVLNEFANVAHGKLGRPWQEVVTALADLRTLCPDIRPIGVATHEAALEIAQRDGFSFCDALIVAAALEAGCVMLLTEDLQDGRVIAGRLAIRNPFAATGR